MIQSQYTQFFQKGQQISICGKDAVIRYLNHDVIFLQESLSGKYWSLQVHEAVQKYQDGELVIKQLEVLVPVKECLTNEELEELYRKEEYVKYILSQRDPLSKESLQGIPVVAARLGDRRPPSKATLARWKTAYVQGGGHFRALAPKKSSGKRIRTAGHFVDDIQEALEERYLTKNPATLLDIYKGLVQQWGSQGHTKAGKGGYPSESTFYDLKDSLLFDDDITQAQIGKSAAQKLKRNALTKFVTNYILERVEIDSMYTSLGVVDDEGRFLGPLMITAAIDVHSRAIVGVSVEVGRGESTEHIVDCLRTAILPKEGNPAIPELYRQYWPMFGKPSQVIADAGAAYTSIAFTKLLALCDISRDTTKVRQPWKKPFIERFFGTMRKSFLQQLPGYISASRYASDLEPDETLKRSASLTVSQFKDELYHYILRDYHLRPHRGLNGDTPLNVWKKGIDMYGYSVPESANVIRMTYPRCATVSLDPIRGVQYKGLKYHSDQLRNIYRYISKPSDKKNPKIEIFITHSDMSHVLVCDPSHQEYLLVPCTNKAVVDGMSLGETQFIKGILIGDNDNERTNYQDRTRGSKEVKEARDRKNKQDRNRSQANPAISEEQLHSEINQLLGAAKSLEGLDPFEGLNDDWENME